MSSAGAPHAACDQSTEVTVAAATVATEYAATEALGGLQGVWKNKVAVLGRRIANRTERPLGACVCAPLGGVQQCAAAGRRCGRCGRVAEGHRRLATSLSSGLAEDRVWRPIAFRRLHHRAVTRASAIVHTIYDAVAYRKK